MVLGKFLFLVAQGVLQASLIFGTAAVLYDVDVRSRLPEWFATSLLAAAMAAGLALAVCAAAASRQQAQLAASFGVLLVSAIGGSMVPRYLMPAWLQQAGWFTPNGWVIDAYRGALGDGWHTAWPAWCMLAVLAAVGLGAAVALTARPRIRLT